MLVDIICKCKLCGQVFVYKRMDIDAYNAKLSTKEVYIHECIEREQDGIAEFIGIRYIK